MAESGYPGFEVAQWYGMLAPAKTPQPIRQLLQQELVNALGQPDVRARLTAEGLRPIGSTPEELAAYFKRENIKYAKVIKAANVQAE